MSYDPSTMGLMRSVIEAPRRPAHARSPREASPRILAVGIASPAEAQRRLLAIAKGERKRMPGEPKVWFASMDAFARVYTADNRTLLNTVRKRKPGTVKELAELVGREPSNVLRTLRTLEHRGLVDLQPAGGHALRPVTTFDVLVVIDSQLDDESTVESDAEHVQAVS